MLASHRQAVFESAELKRHMLSNLSKATRPEVVLASNSASIPVTRIASFTGKADKVVGMHFMHPVHVMSLVEIIAGLDTCASPPRPAFGSPFVEIVDHWLAFP